MRSNCGLNRRSPTLATPMTADKSTRRADFTPDIESMSWIDRARRMVEYHHEAAAFIHRASEQFPVSAAHSRLLLRLWVEADTLDSVIFPLLGELNEEILEGRGNVEATRGVTVRPSGYSPIEESRGEEVVYECGWTLHFDARKGVAIVLSVSETGVFQAVAVGNFSGQQHRIGYPVTTGALQDGLVSAYVSEVTTS